MKSDGIWHTREGREIALDKMEDTHLANTIRMVARARGPKMDLKKDKSLSKLVGEATKRGWIIKPLPSPINNHGRQEWVDVILPSPASKLHNYMHISDFDSRLEE